MKYYKIGLTIVCLIMCLFLIQNLLTPKYMTSLYEGAMIAEYYEEEKDHEVLFIGDCEVYENFSTIALWQNYGITSYIRGGPQQLIWQSYYLMEDALRYETPDVVVFNVLSLKYSEPQSEAYNRLNLDGMKPSKYKVKAVQASMMPEESGLSYLFPLLRFHDRWNELTTADVKYFASKKHVSHNGYYMRNDVKPVDVVPEGPKLPNYRFSENSYQYLDKIRELCAEKGINLVLVKAPSVYPYWYSEWDEQIRAYANEHELLYVNFLECTDEIGLDFDTDTYDGGLHLNRFGAEKLSTYFGKILTEEYLLEDRREQEEDKKIWQKKADDYYAMAEKQLHDIEEFGEIRTFTY